MTDPKIYKTPEEEFDCDEIGARLGMEVNHQRSLVRANKIVLSGWREGVPVRVYVAQEAKYVTEHNSIGLARDVLTHHILTAKVEVEYKFGAGPAMKLLREGTFRSWIKRFGYQDIEVGDQSLDFMLTIKGEPEEEIQKILLDNLGPVRMHCVQRVATLPQSDGKSISAEGDMSTHEREKGIAGLSTLVDLLVAMASTDLAGAEALLALPGSREERLESGQWSVRLQGASGVRFIPKRTPTGFLTRASVAKPQGIPEGRFAATDRQALAEHFGNPQLRDALGTVQDTQIEIAGDEIALCWPCVVQDPERLQAGARLLGAMVNPQHGGAYR